MREDRWAAELRRRREQARVREAEAWLRALREHVRLVRQAVGLPAEPDAGREGTP